MTSLTALEARTTALEYAVFEQFPHTMEAMTIASTQIYAVTVENGEAIAGLRVDMAALQTSLHHDVTDLKAALDLQGDSLRKELGVATAGFRGEMTGFREAMSLRFQKVDGQFNGVHGDIANLQEDVSGLKEDVSGLKEDVSGLKEDVSGLKEDVSGLKEDVGQRFASVDQRFDTLDAKLDTVIAEIRSSKN
jgi:peptidoglycan hydrolase CwlO-like protein